MKCKKQKLVDKLYSDIDKEIYELDEVIDILTDDTSIIAVDGSEIQSDVNVILKRQDMFRDFRNMVFKASLEIDDVDNKNIMTKGERKQLFNLIGIVLWFRRVFKINR